MLDVFDDLSNFLKALERAFVASSFFPAVIRRLTSLTAVFSSSFFLRLKTRRLFETRNAFFADLVIAICLVREILAKIAKKATLGYYFTYDKPIKGRNSKFGREKPYFVC
jgi:hypothetical protein